MDSFFKSGLTVLSEQEHPPRLTIVHLKVL